MKTLSFFERLQSIPPYIIGSIITILIYYQSLFYGFLFDDAANILQRYEIRTQTLSSLVFSGSRWVFYWINSILYSFFTFNPFAYRLIALCIHLINGYLFFL